MSMIDPETVELKTTRNRDQKELTLIMSDEFNQERRSFKSNEDALFTAIHQPGLTNEEIQFYDSSYVTTRDGSLILKTSAEKTTWTEYDEGLQQEKLMSRNYTSAMLQSWNQFCFTGGVLEMSIQLPGGSKEGAGGLWPAAW
jgi:beta-glucan synthesis-associated protein KRE6